MEPVQHLVVTGASGGLGQALLVAFGGWRIHAPDREVLDVADFSAVRDHLADRPVDLLVYAAGMIRDAPLLKLDETNWDQILAVNYQAAAECAKVVLPTMRACGSGHIVFISSGSALHPPAGQSAYATAKAALLGLTRDLAARHGPDNIRVNAILPGFLETRMTAAVTATRKSQILSDHYLERFNTPEVVANFIRYLHDELPHTSGQVFQLDSRV